MAANLEKLVESLSELSVLEAAELVKLLEEKWGVSAAAPVAMAFAGAAARRTAICLEPPISFSSEGAGRTCLRYRVVSGLRPPKSPTGAGRRPH
ncbi:MAG: hypothetical protein HGB17_15170 [Syntrophobacteraceae bacterium]|nr:hypothetical protein [Syntrophobacteraceae bacterium]